MSVDVKGLVFSRNFLDHFETLDKIKLGVDKFFNHKLKQSIKKVESDTIKSSGTFCPIEK